MPIPPPSVTILTTPINVVVGETFTMTCTFPYEITADYFQLYDENNNQISSSVLSSSNQITFDNLTYSTSGTHYFVITNPSSDVIQTFEGNITIIDEPTITTSPQYPTSDESFIIQILYDSNSTVFINDNATMYYLYDTNGTQLSSNVTSLTYDIQFNNINGNVATPLSIEDVNGVLIVDNLNTNITFVNSPTITTSPQYPTTDESFIMGIYPEISQINIVSDTSYTLIKQTVGNSSGVNLNTMNTNKTLFNVNSSGITKDNYGNIYISTINGSIIKLDEMGNYITTIQPNTEGNTYYMGIAVDLSNNIYVSEGNTSKIYKLDSNGSILAIFPQHQSGFGSIIETGYLGYSITIDGSNQILYVFESNKDRIGDNSFIISMDLNGNYIKTIITGLTPGSFISYYDNNLYFAMSEDDDAFIYKIDLNTYPASSTLLLTIRGIGRITNIVNDLYGNIYVSCVGMNGYIYKYDLSSSTLYTFLTIQNYYGCDYIQCIFVDNFLNIYYNYRDYGTINKIYNNFVFNVPSNSVNNGDVLYITDNSNNVIVDNLNITFIDTPVITTIPEYPIVNETFDFYIACDVSLVQPNQIYTLYDSTNSSLAIMDTTSWTDASYTFQFTYSISASGNYELYITDNLNNIVIDQLSVTIYDAPIIKTIPLYPFIDSSFSVQYIYDISLVQPHLIYTLYDTNDVSYAIMDTSSMLDASYTFDFTNIIVDMSGIIQFVIKDISNNIVVEDISLNILQPSIITLTPPIPTLNHASHLSEFTINYYNPYINFDSPSYTIEYVDENGDIHSINTTNVNVGVDTSLNFQMDSNLYKLGANNFILKDVSNQLIDQPIIYISSMKRTLPIGTVIFVVDPSSKESSYIQIENITKGQYVLSNTSKLLYVQEIITTSDNKGLVLDNTGGYISLGMNDNKLGNFFYKSFL